MRPGRDAQGPHSDFWLEVSLIDCINAQGAVRRVILVVKESSLQETPLERFVFEFEWLIPQRDVPAPGDDFTCVPYRHRRREQMTNALSLR